MSNLDLGQANLITFVMVDAGAVEVMGLGAGFALELSKNGGAFAPGAGIGAEIGSGWYRYTTTASECDTVGVLSVRINGAGCVQQNLEYVIESRAAGATAYPYTVRSPTGVIAGAVVTVTSDAAGLIVIAQGISNALGQVVFYLQPGTYYFRVSAAGFGTVVDIETVP